ncbi:MAG: hypothetical protein AB7J32_05470 [Pseudonocardia sp.]
MPKQTENQTMRPDLTRWATPAVGVLIGLAYLAAGWAAGDLTFGLTGLAIMLALSVGLVLAARRSETVRGLLDHRDERISAIDLRATAFAGMVVIVLVIGAFIVEIARGGDGMPYAWLGAAGGIAYVVAVLVQRLRG